MNPSKAQQMEADADRMIMELQTGNTEQAVESEAPTPPELVNDNTDQGAESAESVAAAPQDTAELDRLKAELDKSDQRYRTLAGMIDKRNEENDSLRALVMQLTQSVEQLKQAPVQQANIAKPVSSADREAFGDDLVDMTFRASQETVTAEVAKLKEKFDADLDRIQRQMNTVAEATVQTAVDKFEGKLSDLVPDWRAINVDDGFINWLNEFGMMEVLNSAYSNMDLARTATYFNGYKKFTGAGTAQAKPQPAANLNDFIAPGKSKATPQQVDTASGKQWTGADVTQMYEDKRTGKLSDDQFSQLEADLFSAQKEGRFRA